jgi:hypothetical protein
MNKALLLTHYAFGFLTATFFFCGLEQYLHYSKRRDGFCLLCLFIFSLGVEIFVCY